MRASWWTGWVRTSPLPVELVPFGWHVGGAKIGSAGRESSAATGPRWKALCHRRRPLHCRLRVWARSRLPPSWIRIEQHGGRRGTRAVSRDGFAGALLPGRTASRFCCRNSPSIASAAKPARSAAAAFGRNSRAAASPGNSSAASGTSACGASTALFSSLFWCIYVTTAAERGFGLWGWWTA